MLYICQVAAVLCAFQLCVLSHGAVLGLLVSGKWLLGFNDDCDDESHVLLCVCVCVFYELFAFFSNVDLLVRLKAACRICYYGRKFVLAKHVHVFKETSKFPLQN